MNNLPPFDDDAPDPLLALHEECRRELPDVCWEDVLVATAPLTAAEKARQLRRIEPRRRPRRVIAAALAAACALLVFSDGPRGERLRVEGERLTVLAEAQARTQHYAEAEVLYRRALELQERALGPEHVAVASTLTELADLYASQQRFAKAKPLYERAFGIQPTAVF